LDAHVFTRRVGFVKRDGSGCSSSRSMWRTLNSLGMDVSAAIYVKDVKEFVVTMLLDVGNPGYYGIVEVSTELPAPRPLRGPSYVSAIAAEAARIAADAYQSVEVKGEETELQILFENKKIDLKTMCDVKDIQKAPESIELEKIVRGVETICTSPIYVNLEDVLEDLPSFAAAAARGHSKVLKPICLSDPFLAAVVSSSIGLTVVTSGGEGGTFATEFGF